VESWEIPFSGERRVLRVKNFTLFEITRSLVCLDYVASIILNANHSMMLSGCKTLRSRLRLARRTTGGRMATHRKSNRRRVSPCADGLRKLCCELVIAAASGLADR
jgi:hypothetical protein